MTKARWGGGQGTLLWPVFVLSLCGWACSGPLVGRDGFVDTGEARLFYRTAGQGDPIVVLHGGPGMEHTYLLPGLDILADTFRLIFYDQRGTGRSEGAVDSTTIDIDRFLDDIDAVRRRFGLDRVTLLAHSWAGLLGISYALRYPDRLRALILVNSNEPGSRYQQAAAVAQAGRRTESDAARIAELAGSEAFQDRDTAAINEIYRLAFRSTFADSAVARRLVIRFSDRTARNGSNVARILMTPLQGLDLWPRLGDVRAPVLVVHGVADVMPVEMPEELADSIPNADLALIPRAGHFPWMENPAAFRGAIVEFLDKLDRKAPG